MKSMGRLMYRENALDTVFEKVAVQKVVSVFVVDNFMVGEAVCLPCHLGAQHFGRVSYSFLTSSEHLATLKN